MPAEYTTAQTKAAENRLGLDRFHRYQQREVEWLPANYILAPISDESTAQKNRSDRSSVGSAAAGGSAQRSMEAKTLAFENPTSPSQKHNHQAKPAERFSSKGGRWEVSGLSRLTDLVNTTTKPTITPTTTSILISQEKSK